MDAFQMNHNWHGIENESVEQPHSLEPPGICDAFRDPELLPRIGDEYQVEIPPLVTDSAYHLLAQSQNDPVISSGIPHDFLVGLPISLMWIDEKGGSIKHEPQKFPSELASISGANESVKSESTTGMQVLPEADLKPQAEPMDTKEYNGTDVGKSANSPSQGELKNKMHQKQGSKDYCMVPGSLGDAWSDAEEASFLLGLYIFGKNLVQVKKFVDSKKMGDMLSFYYGKFYRSERYRKWSECRKMRNRRCIYGQRIFTGPRRQELLSRLLPHVLEECQSTLLEVTRTFEEGKLLLEEYVFTLKATVGLNVLIEAVGIGKGKQDLTGIAMEPQKSNQAAPIRPEIPIGKACSTLTSMEIINFLTGGYRLSKARSNDLFWEAVWPRLLARGWHSEQPNDSSFAAASRQSLVFLIPGIKKFSRRKLVKGNHYFDSVSDVLNKVASDPALLELDIGADSKEENGWTNETNVDQVDFPDQRRHCYLKPRIPSRSSDAMKFMIVDTSLANEQTTNVRELRSLPRGMMNFSASRSDSEESDGDSSEEPTDESDSAGNLHLDGSKTTISKSTQINFDKVVISGKENFESNAVNQSILINGSGFMKVPLNIPKDQKADECDGMQPRKATKGHVIQRMRPRNRKILDPVAKQLLRLTACGPMAAGCSTLGVLVDPSEKHDEMGCTTRNADFEGDVVSLVEQPQEKLSSPSSSSRGSPCIAEANISDECTLNRNFSGAEHCCEKTQARAFIDLNLPLPEDAESESFMMEIAERQHDNSISTEDPSGPKTSVSVCHPPSEQPSNLNSRRHSTRNRPLTAKALEALACGFLSIKQKRKSRDDFPLNNRPSRRARSRARITEDFNTGMVDFKGDGGGNGECKSNDDMITELQI